MPRSRRLAPSRFDDKRSPLERLASLAQEPKERRAKRLMVRITKELDASAAPGPWIRAAQTLADDAQISPNAALYLIERFLESVTMKAAASDPEMLRIEAELDRVRRAHGLAEDEDWYVHEGPPEWQALNEEWNRRDDALRAAKLREVGRDDLATLLERDPEEFEARSTAGHEDFWGWREEEDDAAFRPELN